MMRTVAIGTALAACFSAVFMQAHGHTSSLPRKVTIKLPGDNSKMDFVLIPAGEFLM